MGEPCPSPQRLRDFLLGQGEESASRSIEAHLASCAGCVRQLHDLEASDLFVEALKSGSRAAPVATEASPALIARLGALHPKTTPTRAALFSADAVPDEPEKARLTFDFLGPAEGPGELGRLAGCRVLKILGKGGMGVVFQAVDPRLGRTVAIKVLLEARALEPRYLARFQHEGSALARLQHPHIVQIHQVGEHRGRPFFVLEYVAGGTLADLLAHQPQSVHASAELMATLARAVDYAHRQGVIHRDLKPGNILLQSAQPPHPKITDFGLARSLDEAGLTQSDDLLGTPGYIAPELTRGQGKQAGAPVDVYSLGAIFYELLTGRAPFRGATVVDTLEQARTLDPVSPRRLEPKVPRDLETICLKCLEKDPQRRYASAAALAEDLERWLSGKPILARRLGLLARVWRWCRRKPAAAAALSLFLVLMVVGAAWFVVNERREAEEALRKVQQEAADARERGLQDRKRVLLQRIQQIRLTGHQNGWSQRAMELCREGVALGKDDQWRDQAAATLIGLDAVKEHEFKEESSAVAFDKAGKRLLMAGVKRFSKGMWETTPARLWDLDTRLESISKKAGEGPVIFDDEDNPLQLVEEPGPTLSLWNVAAQRQVGSYALPLPVHERPQDWKFTQLALSAKGDYVAAVAQREGQEKTLLIVWEAATGNVKLQREARATALAFGRQGPWLAVAAEEETTIWSLPEGKKIKSLKTGRGPINCLAFGRHPARTQAAGCDAESLAAGETGGVITIWDVAREVPISFCRGSHYEVHALAFSPDGATLGSAGRGFAKLWDVATGRALLDLGYRNTMTGIAFAPDSQRLVISSRQIFTPGGVDIWQLDWGRGLQNLRGLAGQVAQVRFSPDGTRLAALAQNWQVAIIRVSSGKLEYLLDVPQGLVADNAAMVFSPDGRRFAFAAGKQAKLWDLATGSAEKSWPLPPGHVDHLGFHGTGKLLLFRVETQDGKHFPGSEAPAAQHPRVGRIRDLLSLKQAEPVKEIADFNRGVFEASTPPDACFFVVQGVGEKGRFTTAYDGLTGKELWSKPCSPDFQGHGSSLWLDPTGTVMTLISEPRPSGVSLVEMPSGKAFAAGSLPLIVGVHCLGPSVNIWGGVAHIPPYGFHLFRRGDKAPVVILGLDTPTHQLRAEFNAAGTLIGWGNDDGSITVCGVDEVRKRLSEVGLGW